ncbi:hypothetical protein DBR11_01605 [Pedobacter sp. HMWF019]|uniref:hypothetical protein n=1 Tax=Pedobacter sp. HMWF019 TaxID=2056856 RepID=UPI000D335443|nr:hypothetical protein [Pedobacter sp. HMWF019]PTT03690.1 hypothetical protein DBR11_01605 [Pedobacter sp. HMWF019]
MHNISDILSSASLLVAILTTIYSLFYPEIKGVLDISPKSGSLKKDNALDYEKAKIIRNSKVIPLFFGSIVLTLVFIPEFINQLKIAYQYYRSTGFDMENYNTATASFVVVTAFSILLTVNIIIISFKYMIQLKNLNPE